MSAIIDDESTTPLSIGNFIDDLIGWRMAFLEKKLNEGVDPKTIRSYKNALITFEEFAKKHKENTMKTIGAKFINRYLIDYQAILALKDKNIPIDIKDKIISQNKQKNLGINDSGFYIDQRYQNTLNHRLSVVKMLLKYISEENSDGHDYTTLFKKLVKVKIKDKFRDTLSVDEMDDLIDYMYNWPNKYKVAGHKYNSAEPDRIANRDALLLLLYLLTGARGDEVVKIRLRDIEEFELDREKYYKIKIQDAKGGKIREIAVEKEHIQKFVEYFKKELPNSDYYIASQWNKKTGYEKDKFVSADSTRRFANTILKRKGISKHGLHSFRRGFATKKVAHEGLDLATTASMMGNSSSVLERYYLKIDAESTVKKIKK